ncbi:MAG: LysM peptidoglycan-binding domain-containing protein [Verrucomicrobia bacterium]|nr:LysM peptidoglycan-binding domain-containing protein [Verrucomicrobiota bacterium]
MENDSISSTSSESKLPLIVGVLGFALGAAGLVLGIKAKGAAQLASDEAALAKTQVSELGAQLASKANADAVASLQADLAATKEQTAKNEAELQAAIVALQKVAAAPKASASGKSAAPAGPGEYVVAKGDNLGSIAKKNGISLKAIQDLNPGVNPNRLQIGQKLKVK